MITLNKITSVGNNRDVLEIGCLSTDVALLPIDTIDGIRITNNSVCMIIDTCAVKMFDEEFHRWYDI